MSDLKWLLRGFVLRRWVQVERLVFEGGVVETELYTELFLDPVSDLRVRLSWIAIGSLWPYVKHEVVVQGDFPLFGRRVLNRLNDNRVVGVFLEDRCFRAFLKDTL